MKDFDHPNILGLLGVCLDAPDGYPYIILPFMVNGNLKDYLKSKRVHITDVDTYPKVYCVVIAITTVLELTNDDNIL